MNIKFYVDDVEKILEKLIQNGGKKVSEIVRKDYGGLGTLTAVYTLDPEGNCIEIQNWS